ncbi:succinate dehydrogenase/fumarate reductase cytochrome b subunit [Pseudorhizobium tarimense]|uniref:Succinate dehydrogenase/fumarate reductase cytochrome b subunit n=1 Tax=Pseudorhizobium tarimense TaxID=1079109 RepID=A0ABV2H1N4_9HYPH|nr:phage holin family protein [Pseudorhizobium tarimense]MCJ8517930.1 phage holin family protein [Pseudorhizobium tarimense]
MANEMENRPLSELVSGLVSDITGLFRKEINLAKTEASEKMSQAITGIESFAAGLVFAIAAVGVLLAALVNGLAAFFVAQGMRETSADALSSVIVGVIVALLAYGMIKRGLSTLRGENLKFDRTSSSLRRDAQMIKERV